MKLTRLSIVLTTVTVLLAGCSITPPIQKAAESKSAFEDAFYQGETVDIAQDNSGAERYRVFAQGATGFVPQSATRSNTEGRANKFCEQQGKIAKILQERMSTGGPIKPGNYPRSELIFICVNTLTEGSVADVRYDRLIKLKKLLDEGVLTQSEFELEKAKILGEK